MNNNLTEIAVILDRSGSMSGMEADVIGGYNSLINKQKSEAGVANLTTILFDGDYEVLHDRVNINSVEPLTNSEYYARGNTALYDAVGRTIKELGAKLAATSEAERPGKVMVVITTDGEENASREYRDSDIKALIKQQKDVYNWEFIFLGANIDAVSVARDIGIAANRATNFVADSQGMEMSINAVHKAVKQFREEAGIQECWCEEVLADYEERSAQSDNIDMGEFNIDENGCNLLHVNAVDNISRNALKATNLSISEEKYATQIPAQKTRRKR